MDYLGTRDKLVRDLRDSTSKESRTLDSCTKLMDDCSRLFQLLSRVRFSEHFPFSVLPLMEAKLKVSQTTYLQLRQRYLDFSSTLYKTWSMESQQQQPV